jgi:hypothetical protein
MLSSEMTAFADKWPIRKESENIEVLRKTTQYSGNPDLRPMAGFNMEYVEPKSLTNAQTGQVENGGIYKCTPQD